MADRYPVHSDDFLDAEPIHWSPEQEAAFEAKIDRVLAGDELLTDEDRRRFREAREDSRDPVSD